MDESLLLVREPSNPYDRNAIRVDNVLGIQVGQYHLVTALLTDSIPRDVAATFQSLLDTKALKIEGTVTGSGDKWNIPITIQLFTPRAQVTSTLMQLQRRVDIRQGPVVPFHPLPPKVVLIATSQPPSSSPYQSQAPYSSPPPQYSSSAQPSSSPPIVLPPTLPTYNDLIQRSEAFDPRTLRDAPEKFGLSIKDLEKLPSAKQPAQVKTPMLSYQLQGLAWLMMMEHPKLPSGNEVREFWTKRGGNWYNVTTHLYISFLFSGANCSTTTQAPQLARGGILADDMGLGKTLQ